MLVRSNTNFHPRVSAEPVVARLFGALPEPAGVQFRAFASPSRELHVEVLTGAAAGIYPLAPSGSGLLERFVVGAGAGDTYSYLIDEMVGRPGVTIPAGRRAWPFADRRS